jgi:hypothetical protein
LDLANIIYCCTDADLRKDHMVSLLKLYHTELKQSLLQLLDQLPDYCSNENDLWTMIQEDFKIFGKFGLGLSMDILPIRLASKQINLLFLIKESIISNLSFFQYMLGK